MEKVDYCRMSCLDGKINAFKYLLDLFLSDLENENDVKTCNMFDNDTSIEYVKDMLMMMLDKIKEIVIDQDNCHHNIDMYASVYHEIIKDELGKEFTPKELKELHKKQEERLLKELFEESKKK
ncbi:hypothetical protein GIF18_06300 [Campylobacter coli]|uniref:hypothetical protein n=1 Tax=Campylobacter coli TaxID=195 RepID=UPI0012895CD4|nr:hypothetical protein [Campylobacter coli]EAI7985381.1 hypothetical protein [Campylobacter coli]EAJ0856293.1 hypothetical protein [Campylobacter coli]EAL2947431.1 hypothetical protein [Campylobacter coli]ECK6936338.1 hypothetical protein [Campylobacter coli]ECK7948379.1 hypothetical protein [Campylobacter coli]